MPQGCLVHFGTGGTLDAIALCVRDTAEEVQVLAHDAGAGLHASDLSNVVVAIGVLVLVPILLLRLVAFLDTIGRVGWTVFESTLGRPLSPERTLSERRRVRLAGVVGKRFNHPRGSGDTPRDTLDTNVPSERSRSGFEPNESGH